MLSSNVTDRVVCRCAVSTDTVGVIVAAQYPVMELENVGVYDRYAIPFELVLADDDSSLNVTLLRPEWRRSE